MKYSETGKFTTRQKQLAKELAKCLTNLRNNDCHISVEDNEVKLYLISDMKHYLRDLSSKHDFRHPINFLSGGKVTEISYHSKAKYFDQGYITEE